MDLEVPFIATLRTILEERHDTSEGNGYSADARGFAFNTKQCGSTDRRGVVSSYPDQEQTDPNCRRQTRW